MTIAGRILQGLVGFEKCETALRERNAVSIGSG
jgi:hypothetical protein